MKFRIFINEAIKEAIKSNPGISKPRIIKAIGKSRATIERALKELVEAKVVEHRGSKKTGGYYVIEPGESKDVLVERVTEKVTERVTEKVTENQRAILALLGLDPKMTQVQLAEKIGISRRHVASNVGKLMNLGLLRRIGPDKGGHWEVVK